MKTYRILFNMGHENDVIQCIDLENPQEFLDNIKYEGIYSFTDEKGAHFSINLSQVKYIRVAEYKRPTVNS